jgi:hypothetical protein
MNEKQLHALAAEFAKTIKTPENLNQFSLMLKKNHHRSGSEWRAERPSRL